MPSTCYFELNNLNASYFSGEIITGTIILNTTSDINVREISIIFLGETKCKWSKWSSRNSSSKYYESRKVYIDNATVVRGEGVLPAGTHTYTFAITLPLECPTSFEGKYGHIRYELSLKLNRPFRFDNVFKKPLTVIKTIDLNLNPANRIPRAMEETFDIGCLCCSRGKIEYTLKTPLAAYAPGQVVKYSLHIENQSMTDVVGYNYEFTKKVIYTATSPRRKQRHVKDILVSGSNADTCLRLTNRLLEGQFQIPLYMLPTSSPEDFICIQYILKMIIRLSTWSKNSVLKIPIIIGTIPITETLPAIQNMGNYLEQELPSFAKVTCQEKLRNGL